MSNLNVMVSHILEESFGKDQPSTKDGVLAGKSALTFKGRDEKAFSSKEGLLPGEKGSVTFKGKDEKAFSSKEGLLPGEKSSVIFKGKDEKAPQAPHDGVNK